MPPSSWGFVNAQCSRRRKKEAGKRALWASHRCRNRPSLVSLVVSGLDQLYERRVAACEIVACEWPHLRAQLFGLFGISSWGCSLDLRGACDAVVLRYRMACPRTSASWMIQCAGAKNGWKTWVKGSRLHFLEFGRAALVQPLAANTNRLCAFLGYELVSSVCGLQAFTRRFAVGTARSEHCGKGIYMTES